MEFIRCTNEVGYLPQKLAIKVQNVLDTAAFKEGNYSTCIINTHTQPRTHMHSDTHISMHAHMRAHTHTLCM